MKIKVLGPGCKNCKTVLDMVNAALTQLGKEAEVEYVTDMGQITEYIMMTPGIVIDEKVAHEGKPLPSFDAVVKMIENAG